MSQQKSNIKNWIIIILIILVLGLGLITIYKQNKKIKELSNIERPFYGINNATGEQHKYFEYSGLIITSYVNADKLYGFQLVDSDATFEIDCNINKSECKIELIDKKCLIEKTPPDKNGFTDLALNQTGCVTIYSIKGKPEKRVY